MLLLAATCFAVVCSSRADPTKAAISQDHAGNLHINSALNQTVLINGRNVVRELDDALGLLERFTHDAPLVTLTKNLIGCNFSEHDGVNVLQGSIWITCHPIIGLSELQTIHGNLDFRHESCPEPCDRPPLLDIKALTGLPSLKAIGGFLRIWNTGLTNLDGFSALQQVYTLDFALNSALTNVDGLSKLTHVSGLLQIWYNDALLNLNGLLNLKGLYGWAVRICENKLLASVPSNIITLAESKLHTNENVQCIGPGRSPCCQT